ncbi:CBS domain-containing protein [Halovenus sp. WSH3]|uniref:CBS domain-containing protein n=1 Tax=Halovenus carboxidivorans TaxID=2692199 RepID=A0A6B0T2R7_9EURY|nr:CBS domain-containing protein [Halovenus carboxidivorans]MXR50536.1 CBS domain-containing protein [Halovenus carboxidivorans]
MEWEDIDVRAAMSTPVREAEGTTAVTEAARILCEERIGSVLVRGTPDGIITDTDIVRAVKNGRDPETTAIAELKSSPVITVPVEAQLQEGAELMSEHGVKKLVVTDGGEYVGVVTTTDLVEQVTPELGEIISVFATD